MIIINVFLSFSGIHLEMLENNILQFYYQT